MYKRKEKVLEFDIFKFIDYLDEFSFDAKQDIYQKIKEKFNVSISQLHSIDPVRQHNNKQRDIEIMNFLNLNIMDYYANV